MSRLDDAMSRLAAELAAENEQCRAPFAIEQAVLAEFDRVKRRKRGRIWVAAGAIAASVAALWMAEHRPAQQAVAPPAVEADAEQPFVPIPYVLHPGRMSASRWCA